MATPDEVDRYVLQPMQALYRMPYRMEDPEAALAQYGRALTGFKADVLASAWVLLRDRYKKRDWPAISEIREHIDAVQMGGKTGNGSRASRVPGDQLTRFGNRSLYYMSPWAHEAAKGDWLGELMDFCDAHNRQPDNAEAAELRKGAQP